MKAALANHRGRPSLTGPGKLESVDLNPYRAGKRFQQLVFELARDLTRDYVGQPGCEAPTHALFPQIVQIVEHCLKDKVKPIPPADILDVFLSPYLRLGYRATGTGNQAGCFSRRGARSSV